MPNPADIRVAVCFINRDDKILLHYNQAWGSFTLPMTKLRAWRKSEHSALEPEPEKIAAARAAAEVLGQTVGPLRELFTLSKYGQSDRDGLWKFYEFHCYALDLPADAEVKPLIPSEWLGKTDLKDREPISKTATDLVERIGWPI